MDGIQVMASDVTIDLTALPSGARCPAKREAALRSDADRVRIANGTITGFEAFGIYLAEGELDVVENMRILNTSGFSTAPYTPDVDPHPQQHPCEQCIQHCRLLPLPDREQHHHRRHLLRHLGQRRGGGRQCHRRQCATRLAGHRHQPPDSGYGSNILVGNNGGGAQVFDNVFQLHPNVCEPACP